MMERGHEIKVLDKGYARFVDSLGTDASIVEAARTSTGRGFVSWEAYYRCKKCERVVIDDRALRGERSRCCGADIEIFPRGDLGILDFMYRNGHTTPFEMCELIIDVKIPMDAWRQWIRHRTASVNEYSTRYSPAIDEMAATAPGEWRTQGKTNRQGSGEFLPGKKSNPYEGDAPGLVLTMREAEFHKVAREVYEERLAAGVAKEQARKDLPLSNYTAARWKCDLHNVFHFLGKRLDPAAQLEIRQYAEAVAEIVKAIWPRSYALFEEYTRYGVRLSRTEWELLRAHVDREVLRQRAGATAASLLAKLEVPA